MAKMSMTFLEVEVGLTTTRTKASLEYISMLLPCGLLFN